MSFFRVVLCSLLLGLSGFSLLASHGELDPPRVIFTAPLNGSEHHLPSFPVVLVFHEDVFPSSQDGSISIYEVETGALYFTTAISGSSVEFNQNAVNIYPPEFEQGKSYYVTVDGDAIEDADGNLFPGFDDPETFSFTTDDGTPPAVVTYEPANGSVVESTCSCIKMTFNKLIEPGDGTIRLYEADGTLVESVNTNGFDSRMQMDGFEVNVNFSTDFEDEKSYYITMSAGAFRRFFTGLGTLPIAVGEWGFTTSFRPRLVSLSPAKGAADGDISKLELEFNVDMQREFGTLDIYHYEKDSLMETIGISSMTVNGNIVSIVPKVKYPLGLRVYITASREGLFSRKDNGAEYLGLTQKGDWDFVIGATRYRSFETTWELEENNGTITLPMEGDGYYYSVDWGDGSKEVELTGPASHTYANAGEYTVSISGYFPRFQFKNAGDKDKILSVSQWGSMNWDTLDSAFYGCSKFNITATDVPILSGVKSMNSMFRDTPVFNADLGDWDTQQVTDMAYMFYNATAYNHGMSGWRTSKVTDMTSMFEGATSFNGAVSGWSLTNVLSMKRMFYGATAFNQSVRFGNTYNVEDMSEVFMEATAFNRPLSGWSVSSATTMKSMFENATSFDQPIGYLRLKSGVNMERALHNTAMSNKHYDETLEAWFDYTWTADNVVLGAEGALFCNSEYLRTRLIEDHGWVITGDSWGCRETAFITTWLTEAANDSIIIPTMGSGYNYTIDWGDGTVDRGVTGNAKHFFENPGEQQISISGHFPRIYMRYADGFAFLDYNHMRNRLKSVDQWGTLEWGTMAAAFVSSYSLEIKATDAPNLSRVSSMSEMFKGCDNLNSDFNHWDVSTIRNMEETFAFTDVFNGAIGEWDVSNVWSMRGMFRRAVAFNQNLNDWDVSGVGDMYAMFSDARSYNQPMDQWDVSNVRDMTLMFSAAKAFNGDVTTWDVSRVERLQDMFWSAESFNQDIGDWDVSKVFFMSGMFRNAKVFNQDLSRWNMERVQYISSMFSGAEAFNQPVESWNLRRVESITAMFAGAKAFNQPVEAWDMSNITIVAAIFQGASSFNQPLAKWDVSNATSMSNLFDGATAFNQPIGNWDTGNVETMEDMFQNASSFDQDISQWDVSNVTNMRWLFRGATSFNQDISDWDIGAVEEMRGIFMDTDSFDQDLTGWDFSSVNGFFQTFDRAGLSRYNYDRLLLWLSEMEDLVSDVNLSGEGLKYCAAEDARDKLINEKGWGFIGDALDCSNTESFITTWQVTAGDLKVTIPTLGNGYDYTVDWGDGVVQTAQTGNAAHTYDEAGLYTISITGDFPRIYFNNGGDKEKIQSIQQWGDIQWQSMENAFAGCSNLAYYAVDTPDLSGVTSTSNMFADCTSLNGHMNRWDVSTIVQMDSMFFNTEAFDQSLGDWAIGAVTDMTGMLSNSDISQKNYDEILNGWASLSTVQSNITLGAHGLRYCEAESVRMDLINNSGWTIEGDVLKCPSTSPPDIISPPAVESPEGQIEAVYVISVTDQDTPPEELVYSLGTGLEETLFEVEGNHVNFLTEPDFEAPHDANQDNIYHIEVIVSDGTFTDQRVITIEITDRDETPPRFISAPEKEYEENDTEVAYFISARNNDFTAPDYTLLDGLDSDLFTHEDNRISFKTVPDYEAPHDSNGDNAYQFEIMASDGWLESTMVVTIYVVDVDENAPVITSDSEASVDENNVNAFYTVAAEDESPLSYRLGQGGDVDYFSIQGAEVSFKAGPDYENAEDENQDNVYEFTVIATDGLNEVEKAVMVTVNDVDDEAPVVTSATEVSVEENTTGAVYTITATDVDSDPSRLIFSMRQSLDAVRFEFVGSELFFVSTPDFEEPRDADRNNIYDLTFSVTDGFQSTDVMVSIEVTDIEDLVTSIDDAFFSQMGVSVYPIPASKNLFLKRDLQGRQLQFQMVNAQGIVQTEGVLLNATTEVDLSQVAQGMYFLRLTDGVRTGYKKILVEK